MKSRVNLYSATLLPPEQRLTFARLMAYATGLILLCLLVGAYSYWQLSQSEFALQQASSQKQQLDQQKLELEAQIAARKPDPALVARVDLESQQLELKQLLMSELAVRTSLTSRGFGPVLKDLARVSDASVWLSRIAINEQHFMFEGFADHPQSIPLWVGKLKTTSTLKGQAFSSMTMDRGEDKPLAFTLTSETPVEPTR
ncbi:PilN domain-containing protein [Shewanella sp. KJ2020]|uniref:PilN domain-containing protein n=1 Tax=Shewanella sp. KJ2020 TaxID=2919172 RepID=UPI0020A78E27|nr:PilN domain-containing protein [Shewanella sp. KJ2020]MCP3128653.1 fimbrial assembly protein [Shewanella sp. KJ2020]